MRLLTSVVLTLWFGVCPLRAEDGELPAVLRRITLVQEQIRELRILLDDLQAHAAALRAAERRNSPPVPVIDNVGERWVRARNSFELGMRAEERKDYKAAADHYTVSLELDAGNDAGFLHRGLCYTQLGDTQLALADLNESLRLQPDNSQAYLARAEANYGRGEYNAAIQDLGQAINRNIGNVTFYTVRARAYEKLGQGELALEDCRKAIGISPNLEHGFLCLAQTLLAMKRDAEALAALNDALAVNPASEEARKVAENLMTQPPAPVVRQKLAPEAATDEFSPRKAFALTLQGRELAAHGDFGGAIELFSHAIDMDPKLALAYNSRGYAFLRSREYPLAVSDFNEALRLKHDYTNAALNLAIAERLMKQTESISMLSHQHGN